MYPLVCVCLYRRLNTLNKCALMRLEISPQRKRVSAHAYTWTPFLPENPLCMSPRPQLHFLTSTISSLLATGQIFLTSSLMKRHLLALFLYHMGCANPRGKEDSFNVSMKGLHSLGPLPTQGVLTFFLKFFLILLAHHKCILLLWHSCRMNQFKYVIMLLMDCKVCAILYILKRNLTPFKIEPLRFLFQGNRPPGARVTYSKNVR